MQEEAVHEHPATASHEDCVPYVQFAVPLQEPVVSQLHPAAPQLPDVPYVLQALAVPVQELVVFAVHPVVLEHCDEPNDAHDGEPVQVLAVQVQFGCAVQVACDEEYVEHAACVPEQVFGPALQVQPVLEVQVELFVLFHVEHAAAVPEQEPAVNEHPDDWHVV